MKPEETQNLNPENKAAPADAPAVDQPPKKPRNKAIWIIITVIIVLGLVAGGWLIYTRVFNQKKPAVQQAEVQPDIQTAEVSITATGFNPATITIKKGDQVMWKNTDTKAHRIFAEPYPTKISLPDLDSEALQPGASYGFIFEQAGTYKYTDYYNPTKFLGTIVVQ